MNRSFSSLTALVIAVYAAGECRAQDGFDWVTIGDPGNRATNADETPLDPTMNAGAVGYKYRISKTKLDNDGYLEFVRAYAPYWKGEPWDIALTGYWNTAYQDEHGNWNYVSLDDSGPFAARIGWEMSARYCNWLHNNKADAEWAFESGVYDTSTFFRDEDGNYHHQTEPAADARYWIPSRDEWIKAAYYDPDRYGEGAPGYWRYPDAGMDPLVMALPEDGGETIGDLLWQDDPGRGLGGWNLGEYPDVQSPWGLLDISATAPDWTSTFAFTRGSVYLGGSLAGSAVYWAHDQIDVYKSGFIMSEFDGALRLASRVPTPHLLPVYALLFHGRKRRSK